MTPEEMKFWLDVLASPAVVTFAGGMMGAVVTLVATFSKNRHDSDEREKAWKREEERRKEERAFADKRLAYEEFQNTLGRGPSLEMTPSLGKLLLYAPYEVKIYARDIIHHLSKLNKLDKNTDEYNWHYSEYYRCLKCINVAIIEDIDRHFNQYNTTSKKWAKDSVEKPTPPPA